MISLPDRLQSLRGKRILVTGAAGFIGGHLFRRLVEYGLNATGTVLYPEEAEKLRSQGYHIQYQEQPHLDPDLKLLVLNPLEPYTILKVYLFRKISLFCQIPFVLILCPSHYLT